MLLFSSNELDVILQPGDEKFLLITFSPAGARYDQGDFWAKSAALKNNLSVIGFAAKSDAWYPAVHTMPAIDAIRGHLLRYAERITFGASMGAYATLKYGSRLGATTAIAFSPQWSIDPARLPPIARRWSSSFNPRYHGDMQVSTSDMADRAFIFYDPYTKSDAYHAKELFALSPSVTLVPMYCAGHEPIRGFAGSQKMLSLIDKCRRNEIAGLKSDARRQARTKSLRIGFALKFWLDRSPWKALEMARSYGHLLSPSDLVKFKIDAAASFVDRKHFDEADFLANEALYLSPNNLQALKILASVYAACGRLSDAEDVEHRILSLSPGNISARLRLASIHTNRGQPRQAVALLTDSLASGEQNFDILNAMSRAYFKLGDLDKASQYGEMAMTRNPNDPFIHHLLAYVYMEQGRFDKARAENTISLRLRPHHDDFVKLEDKLSKR